jgi:hypothetical protein
MLAAGRIQEVAVGVLASVFELGQQDDALYGLLLFLHIICAIVGFGAVVLNGVYGAESKKRPGPGGLAIAQANFAVTKSGEYFIYAVFVFGFLLVLVADEDAIGFGDTWVWLSMLIYLAAIAFSHAWQLPNGKKMIALAEELNSAGPPPEGAQGPPPQVAQMEETGKKLAMGGAILNIALLLILYLMIFKPGFDA